MPPNTTTRSGLQPEVAGHGNHDPQSGVPRDQPPPQPADTSQEWRGTAPEDLSQE